MTQTCRNCRWWNGDRNDWGDTTGKCHGIHASSALPDDVEVRLFPADTNAWVQSHRDFSCLHWEKMRASKD